jgi:hypothetical protein
VHIDFVTTMSPDSFVQRLFAIIKRDEPSKGKRNELRAVAAFQAEFSGVPKWFVSIENACLRLDSAGVDVVVHTDIWRDIHVQIKSCEEKARLFRLDQEKGRYKKDIVVVVISEEYTPAQVRAVILSAVAVEYRRLVSALTAHAGATFIPAA